MSFKSQIAINIDTKQFFTFTTIYTNILNLFLELLWLENAISKISKKKNILTPLWVAYYFLIDFSKILQNTFSCNQPRVLNILKTWEQTFTKFRVCTRNRTKKPTKNSQNRPSKFPGFFFLNELYQFISVVKIWRNLIFLTWFPLASHGMILNQNFTVSKTKS